MARIHVLGNSNAYGFGLKDRSWPSLIKADTNRRRDSGDQPRITTVHLASPGNLLHHILDSGLLEASVSCNRRGQQIGVFCVGACEASILRSRGQTESRRSKKDFRNDLNRLAVVANVLNNNQPPDNALQLILMGTVKFDGTKSSRSLEGDDFSAELTHEYNGIIKDYAEVNGVQYVDLYPSFNQHAMLATDGIHLSEPGEAFVYSRLMPSILATLGVEFNPQSYDLD